MAIVTWDKSLEIGHQEIDDQHKNLINIINKLHSAITDGKVQNEIKLIMMELYKYTAYHFSQEETLMRKSGYNYMSEHLAAHDEFIQNLDLLAEKVNSNNASIGKEIISLLIKWLLLHISVTDKELAECLPKT